MAYVFGLDLGTTNTLAAVHYPGQGSVHPFLDRNLPHPSVVQYQGANVTVGREAREQLDSATTGVIGDFVRSPKQFLGSGLPIHVGGVAHDPSEVVAEVIAHTKAHAESQLPPGEEFHRVVATIPVTMDGRGRRDLRDAASSAGVEIEQFVHEPLAALYGYFRRDGDPAKMAAKLQGKLIVVFDWGGGTLDVTLCRVDFNALIQVENLGDREIGGDRFDERLMRLVHDLHVDEVGATENETLVPGARSKLNAACEQAKIRLSRAETAEILVPRYVNDGGVTTVLECTLQRREVEELTADLVARGLGVLDSLLQHAGVPIEAVELCVATGGMVEMPAIREGLHGRFGGPSRVPRVEGGDRIIAEGAAWIASDRQQLTLAKPFEVLYADDTFVELLPAETELPRQGASLVSSTAMYCVDPRDGFARFVLARPKHPERAANSDLRSPYGVAVLAVDPNSEPLFDRLSLKLEIDEDLIATVTVSSDASGDTRRLIIHDLEFGLFVGAKGE